MKASNRPRGVRARALVSTAHALAALALLDPLSRRPPSRLPARQRTIPQGPASTITPIAIPRSPSAPSKPPRSYVLHQRRRLRSSATPSASRRGRRLDRQSPREHDRDAGASPSANALANLADAWQAKRSRLVALNGKLTRRATLAQQRVEQIETMRATWVATQASAREAAAPPTVLEQIDATMAVIAAARRNADDGLAHVLALQDRTVKEIARCDEVLARIAKTGNALVGSLVAPDTLPIWGPQAAR